MRRIIKKFHSSKYFINNKILYTYIYIYASIRIELKNWIIFHDDIHEPINSTDLGQNNRNVEKIFRHKTLKKIIFVH